MTTEIGGEGRNLRFCSQMINYDLPWNPMKIEQRIGRFFELHEAAVKKTPGGLLDGLNLTDRTFREKHEPSVTMKARHLPLEKLM